MTRATKFKTRAGYAIIGGIKGPLSSMSQRSHLPAWLLPVPQRLFRGAWLSTLAIVLTIVISEQAEFVFPMPFLVLLITVGASGALGGFASGMISGLLMTATILYFWSKGIGPEGLTGTLPRAILGCIVAVAIGSYLGLMREKISALLSELEARQLDLKRVNRELADRVAEQTADLQRVSDRLRDSQDRLVRVTRRWIETEEMERRNMARDLHDDIGQGLTALHLNLESSKKFVADVPHLQDFVVTATALINQTINSVRRLSMTLRPSILDDFGLIAATREHASMQFGMASIEYDLRHEGNDKVINSIISTTAFRLIQEAIKNVIKHSDASHASIGIQIKNDMLVVYVRDNGKGFEASQTDNESQHFGLISMLERASLMAGSCKIWSEPGNGTDIEITLPLSVEEVVA